jgi:hypothetical protein
MTATVRPLQEHPVPVRARPDSHLATPGLIPQASHGEGRGASRGSALLCQLPASSFIGTTGWAQPVAT